MTGWLALAGLASGQYPEELADVRLADDRVRERQVLVERVSVPSPLSLPRDVSRGHEIANDAVDGTLGDPDTFADVSQARFRIAGDADEDLAVVGQEAPLRCGCFVHGS